MTEKTTPAATAVRLLRENAESIKCCVSIDGMPQWWAESDSKQLYDEHIEAADALENAPDSIAELKQENRLMQSRIERLGNDALRAASFAFGLMARDYPDDLPEDAQALAKGVKKYGFPLLPDGMGVEEIFIHIIRDAMLASTATPGAAR